MSFYHKYQPVRKYKARRVGLLYITDPTYHFAALDFHSLLLTTVPETGDIEEG
jgi:hypothetical protein